MLVKNELKKEKRKGIIAQNLDGYNFKEKVQIYGGIITGALAPIVGLKVLLSQGVEGPGSEIYSWGASVVSNIAWAVISPFTSPLVYSTLAGTAIGSVGASFSKNKRIQKENLENSLNKLDFFLKDSNDLEEKQEEFVNEINNYRNLRKSNGILNPKTVTKYDKRLAKSTQDLKYVPIENKGEQK